MKYCSIVWMPGAYINMRVELLACAPASRCGMGLLVPLEAAGGIAFQESRVRDRERRQGDAPQHTAPPTPPPAGTRDGGGATTDREQNHKQIKHRHKLLYT